MLNPKESGQFRIYEFLKKEYKLLEGLNQGYTKVSFGQGRWVNERRIAGICVFYNDNLSGGYMSYEYPEFRDGNSIRKLQPFGARYTQKELQDHVNEFKIQFVEKFELAGLKWDEYKIVKKDNPKKY